MLLVKMTHYDPSSGEIAIYSDAIPIVDCPKLKPQLPGSVPTGINVVIPDPKNTPLVHHRLTKQDGLNQPGIIVEVERDYVGYFYRIEGQKYYIPERP